MEFEMNEQRKSYLEAKGKIVLNACPGSGKTTAIAKKLIELQKEYDKVLGQFSGVACLSFTNIAKDEINEAYTKLSGNILRYPHHVSTIDSFINHFITLPFYNLINRDFNRPKILDGTSILDDIWVIQYRDKNGKIKDGLKWDINKFKAKNGRSIYYSYPPSKIRIESDGSYTIDGKLPSSQTVDLEIFNKYCRYIKGTQFTKGLISTSDSAYIALYLLKKNPKIGTWLSIRFPHIIVDEAQDNSALQHALFEKLVEQGLSNIELIGDPYQSLYEWRDADPGLFLKKYKDSQNWLGLDLTDNRRSPQRIIDCFSLIRKQADSRINSTCQECNDLPILVYKYTETNSSFIVHHFEKHCENNKLSNNQIVVRGNTLKNQMLGKGIEQNPWKIQIPYELISARNDYIGNNIKSSIKTLRNIAATLLYEGNDFHEFKEFVNRLKDDSLFNAKLFEILNGIPSFGLTISDWTMQTQKWLSDKLGLKNEVNFELKNRNSKYFDKTILIDPLENHFKKPYSERKIPITTVHQVKGKTLDSILIFFNKTRHPNNITFDDIISDVDTFPSEKQRIIYVAMSRPKHLLAMAFPVSISNETLLEKFGREINIITEVELYE